MLVVGVHEDRTYAAEVARRAHALHAGGSMLVLCGRPSLGDDVPTKVVGYDNGAFAITDHLISQGHRRIQFIGGPEKLSMAIDRLAGHRRALELRGPDHGSIPDNHFALPTAPSQRSAIHPIGRAGRTASSFSEPSAGERVTTTSIVRGPWEIRVHEATSADGVWESGYALGDDSPPATVTGPQWALTRRADGLNSAIIGLYGWQHAEVTRDLEANAFGPHSAKPRLSADRAGLHVSLIVLSGDAVHPAALRDAITVETVTIAFPDGDSETIPRRPEGQAAGSGRVSGAVDQGQHDDVEDLFDVCARQGLLGAGEFGGDQVEGQRPDARVQGRRVDFAASVRPRPDLLQARSQVQARLPEQLGGRHARLLDESGGAVG